MRSILLVIATAVLTACGGGGSAMPTVGTVPTVGTKVCVSGDTKPFWFYCETGNPGLKESSPPAGYFVRTLYDEWNSDLEANGIAYAVDGQYFLKGSNEPIGKADQPTLVMEVSKGHFVVYR